MTLTEDELLERRREGGRQGGKARVPKGTAKLSPEKRREISRLGAIATNRIKAEKKRQAQQHEN